MLKRKVASLPGQHRGHGCRVYGISAWNVHLAGAYQVDLVITPPDEPEITVDNIEVAQFI